MLLVGAFSKKSADYSSDIFFRNNELTDFVSFISWFALTLNCVTKLCLLALGIEVTAFLEACQAEGRGFESRPWPKTFRAGFFGFVSKFFLCLLRVPLHFFSILRQNGCSKLPKGPLLHFSALCDLPETKII